MRGVLCGGLGVHPLWRCNQVRCRRAASLSRRRSFDPLMVSYSPLKYNKYMMSAAMLSNDQSSIGPIRRMQVRCLC